MKVNELKEIYGDLAKKYKLPTFKEINEDFEIYKAGKDRDCILRSVRKVMMDKIVNAMSFSEMLLNGVNVPRMYLPYLRAASLEDRKSMERIYSILSELSILSLQLELTYSENGEADLIKKVSSSWKSIRPEFKRIMESVHKPNIDTPKKERSYFG